jgi:hypothetical protein
LLDAVPPPGIRGEFFLGMMTVLGVLRFDRSPAGDKQLKYSLK